MADGIGKIGGFEQGIQISKALSAAQTHANTVVGKKQLDVFVDVDRDGINDVFERRSEGDQTSPQEQLESAQHIGLAQLVGKKQKLKKTKEKKLEEAAMGFSEEEEGGSVSAEKIDSSQKGVDAIAKVDSDSAFHKIAEEPFAIKQPQLNLPEHVIKLAEKIVKDNLAQPQRKSEMTGIKPVEGVNGIERIEGYAPIGDIVVNAEPISLVE